MGEIRSTLDIIMEKAKKLEVTEKEKESIRRKEIETRARGMVQKYLDGLLTIDHIIDEIDKTEEDSRQWFREKIAAECIERIDFEKDNNRLLVLMERVFKRDLVPLKEVIEEFREQMEDQARKLTAQMMRKFEQRGIKGDAVVANYRADPVWRVFIEEHRRNFRQMLDKVIQEEILKGERPRSD